MDTALELKIKLSNNQILSHSDIIKHLNNSDVFALLIQDFDFNPLNLVWRLTQLAEIPYAWQHPQVIKWTNLLAQTTYTSNGFSLDGKDNSLLACYNAIITSILINLKYSDTKKIEKGINWIINYQNFKRNEQNKWEGERIHKYGGCMKSTPCFIGIVKSSLALSHYVKSSYFNKNNNIINKLNQGLHYILDHNVYLKQSNSLPITKDITKLTYPFTYKTNIIEILTLLKDNNLHNDIRCSLAKSFIKQKEKKQGYWWNQSTSIQKNKTWILFDSPKQKGEWITYKIQSILK